MGRPRFTELEAARLLRPLLESVAYLHDLGECVLLDVFVLLLFVVLFVVVFVPGVCRIMWCSMCCVIVLLCCGVVMGLRYTDCLRCLDIEV